MPLDTPAGAPRHLLVLFLAVTVIPTAGLIWLGAQLLSHDQDRARQQLTDQLDLKATDITAAILRDLDAPPGLSADSDALVVTIGPQGVRHSDGAPLLFHPTLAQQPEPPAATWETAELAEDRSHDSASAEAIYRRLALSRDPAVRAGALVRLARTVRRAGNNDEALRVYDQLSGAGNDDVRVFGDPASLVAGLARVRLLEQLHRSSDRVSAAAAIKADLSRGRWPIDRAAFINAWTQVGAGATGGGGSSRLSELTALAIGVDVIWREWRDRDRASSDWHGRRTMWLDGRNVSVVWRGSPVELTAFVAGTGYFEHTWRPRWNERRVAVALLDDDGRLVLGAAEMPGPVVTRARAITGLPWTVRVSSAAPAAELAELGNRQRRFLLVLVLSLAAFLVVSGAYFVARSVRRELAVARMRSDFVSAVSHEFRTPLTSMSHLIELLRGQRPVAMDEARRIRYYDALAQETDRLRRFVETLLDFGRLESGAAQYEFERVDTAAVVTGVVDRFGAEFAGDARLFDVTLTGPIPNVRVDRDAFGLAFRNLLDNAVKYSPGATPIHVALRCVDSRVMVAVRDDGPGIPAAEQRAIFDKFVRGASARKSGIRGSGVGLAVARQIIRAHGGDIGVDSAPGHGSTFTISLPAARDSQAAERPALSSAQETK